METPREYYYTYYSYEEWGRGYFGSRTCRCLPEEDANYFGSFKDKSFKPTQKIILKDDYATREEAYADEIILQQYYKVVENPHFANRAYQTSTKFYYTLSPEQALQNGKKGSKKAREMCVGIFSMTKEELSVSGKKGAKKLGDIMGPLTYKKKIGVHGRTKEQMSIDGKKAGKKTYELGVGVFAMSSEDRSKASSKGGTKCKENGTGIFGLTKEQRQETGRKSIKKTNSQRWMCTETGYVSTPAGLSAYQKARGIDTSKRKRIS